MTSNFWTWGWWLYNAMYGAAILFPGHPYIESATALSNIWRNCQHTPRTSHRKQSSDTQRSYLWSRMSIRFNYFEVFPAVSSAVQIQQCNLPQVDASDVVSYLVLQTSFVTLNIDTIRHGYETNRKSNTKSHTDVMLGLWLCSFRLPDWPVPPFSSHLSCVLD